MKARIQFCCNLYTCVHRVLCDVCLFVCVFYEMFLQPIVFASPIPSILIDTWEWMLTTAILEETTLRKVCLFSERPYVEPTEGFLFWWRTFRVQKGTFIWLSHKKWCQKLIFWTPYCPSLHKPAHIMTSGLCKINTLRQQWFSNSIERVRQIMKEKGLVILQPTEHLWSDLVSAC